MLAPPPHYVPRSRPRASRRRRLDVAGALLSVAAALALTGCGPSSDTQFAPACPALSLLRDGGEISSFTPGGRDVTNLILRARITAVPAKCVAAGAGKVRATLSVTADVQRGPAASDSTLSAPYFVAVADGNRVMQEQDFSLAASFPANVTQVSATGDEIELLLPVGKSSSAAAYQIYVGFRLSPEQLAYNRGHRIP